MWGRDAWGMQSPPARGRLGSLEVTGVGGEGKRKVSLGEGNGRKRGSSPWPGGPEAEAICAKQEKLEIFTKTTIAKLCGHMMFHLITASVRDRNSTPK